MGATVDETALIAALRRGDERVFADLVDQHSPSMLRVARGYVPNQQIAEEVGDGVGALGPQEGQRGAALGGVRHVCRSPTAAARVSTTGT